MSQPSRNWFNRSNSLKVFQSYLKCDSPAWGTAATSSFSHLSYLSAKGNVLQHFAPIVVYFNGCVISWKYLCVSFKFHLQHGNIICKVLLSMINSQLVHCSLPHKCKNLFTALLCKTPSKFWGSWSMHAPNYPPCTDWTPVRMPLWSLFLFPVLKPRV